MTLNARTRENAEYLNVLMLNINDIKDKLDKNNLSSTLNFQNDNSIVTDIFSKFPICNNDQLECLTNSINDQNIEQLVIIINNLIIFIKRSLIIYIMCRYFKCEY